MEPNSRFCFCTLQPKYYVENLSHFIYGAYLSSFNKLIDSSEMSSSPNFIHFFLPNVHLNLDCFDPCSCYFVLLLLGGGGCSWAHAPRSLFVCTMMLHRGLNETLSSEVEFCSGRVSNASLANLAWYSLFLSGLKSWGLPLNPTTILSGTSYKYLGILSQVLTTNWR